MRTDQRLGVSVFLMILGFVLITYPNSLYVPQVYFPTKNEGFRLIGIFMSAITLLAMHTRFRESIYPDTLLNRPGFTGDSKS